MVDKERPDGEDDDEQFEAMARVQIDAMNRLGDAARKFMAWDPSAAGATDLFTKMLVMRAEVSALLRLCINAGVFTYREYVDMFAEEARTLAADYEREGTEPAIERSRFKH